MSCLLRTLVTLVLVVSAVGCAIDQKKEVGLYRSVLDSHLPAPEQYSSDAPLTLRQAMLLANQSNEQLAIKGEDYVQALIAKNRLVATFLPTVSFQPSFTIEQRPRDNAGTTTGGGFFPGEKERRRLDVPVVGGMNLFRGFADVANLSGAESAAASRRESLLDAQATILVNVAQVYFQVLRSERSVDVLQNTLKVQEARLSDVRQQLNNQLATKLAVAQTRAQVDATRVTLVQAQSDVRNGRTALSLLIGVDSVKGKLSEDVTAPTSKARPAAADFESIALESRQDLLAARTAVDAARTAVDAAVSEYYPSITLNVTGYLYREFYADASKWNSLLQANLPIFTGGIIEADVRLAWSRLRQAALYESYLRRQVLRDVRTAYENLVTADRRITELEDEVGAANDALIQARNAFTNGLAINLDVLTAQDQLLNSELQLTSAQFDRTVFYFDLVRATGRIGDMVGQGPLSPAPVTRPSTVPAATSSTRAATSPS